jgi:hypothetical protein
MGRSKEMKETIGKKQTIGEPKETKNNGRATEKGTKRTMGGQKGMRIKGSKRNNGSI